MMDKFVEIFKGCAKGLLISLNLLCILVALCTFGFAVVDINVLKQYGEQRSSGTYAGDVVISVASCLLAAIAIFGCVAIARNSAKMLYLYVSFIMALVVCEVMITIYVSIQRYGLQFRVTEWIRDDFYKNVTDDDRGHYKLWDDLQTTYECCGLNGPEDYTALGREISLSCCPRAYRARTEYARTLMYRACVESASYYQEGCEDVILKILEEDGEWLLGVAVISFWFESIGMLLALWMVNQIKNSVQIYKHTVKY